MDSQLLEEKSIDSLVFELDEEEIQLPVDMQE